MNELNEKNLKFFYKAFKYEGKLLETTDSHFKILDSLTNKVFHLPKSETVVEEL